MAEADRMESTRGPVVVPTQITSREIIEWMQETRLLTREVHELIVKIKGNGAKGMEARLDEVEEWMKTVSRILILILIPLIIASIFFIGGVLTHTITVSFVRGG